MPRQSSCRWCCPRGWWTWTQDGIPRWLPQRARPQMWPSAMKRASSSSLLNAAHSRAWRETNASASVNARSATATSSEAETLLWKPNQMLTLADGYRTHPRAGSPARYTKVRPQKGRWPRGQLLRRTPRLPRWYVRLACCSPAQRDGRKLAPSNPTSLSPRWHRTFAAWHGGRPETGPCPG